MRKGLLTGDDVLKILVLQEECCESFCKIAVKEHFLTQGQADEILKEQRDAYLLFGEALVKIGVVASGQIEEQLSEFKRQSSLDV